MRTGRVAQKRGFSLVETIVSVGIVAAMAAVVVPQVVKQFDASDTTSLQQDLKNIQTAIETFTVNHRGVFPGDLDDLANPLSTAIANDTSLTGTGTVVAYTSATLWEGPYLDFSFVNGNTKTSGYGGLIQDNFVCYNATGNTHGLSPAGGQACPTPTTGDQLFLAIRVTGLGTDTDARFIAINDMFDNGATEAGNRATQGRVRWINVGTTTPTVFFLATPLGEAP